MKSVLSFYRTSPATAVLIGLMIAGALIPAFSGTGLLPWMTAGPESLKLVFPLATHPFFGTPIQALFISLLMLAIGPPVERDLTTPGLAILWVVGGAVAGLLLALSGAVTFGPAIASGAVLGVYAGKHPDVSFRIYGVFPVTAFWIFVIDLVFIGLNYAGGRALWLPFIAIAVPVAMYWVSKLGGFRGLFSKFKSAKPKASSVRTSQTPYRDKYFEDVKERERNRAERERLKKLFESSSDDPQ